MSRKFWIISAVAAGALVVLGLAAVGGYFLYRQNQTRQWLAEANEAFEKSDWETAVRRYAFYLNREREDIGALERYAQASLNQAGNRRTGLSQAATAYRQILHYDPSQQDAQEALFELQKKLGAWHEVHYLAGRMLENDPGNAGLMHEQALALYRIGNRDGAIAAYRELIDQGVAKPEAFANLARLLRETNLAQQAEDILNTAVELHPENPQTFVSRADYFLEGRDFDKAREEFEKAKALAEDDPEVIMLEAKLALVSGDYDLAIEASRKTLERDPAQARMYLVLSQALAAKGDKATSIDVLRNVDPAVRRDNPELYVQFAEQLINEQELDEALQVIDVYEKTYPDHQTSLNYLRGRVFLVQGNTDEAASLLVSVIEQNPAMAPARFFLAVANLLQGKRKEARNHLEVYLRDNPNDESAKRLLAEAMGVQPDPEQVIQSAQAILGNQQAQPEALVSSALALLASALREGTVAAQIETIEKLFNRTIDLDPAKPRAYGGLADAYVAAGSPEKATQTLKRAEQAGVPAQELARAWANVALAEGAPDAAWKAFEESVAGQGTSAEEVRQWARFFSVREQPDLARRALTNGAESLTEEPEKAELAVERLLLELRLGNFEEALRLVGSAESKATGFDAAEQQLQRVKGELVWRLMQEGDQGKIEEARRILSQDASGVQNNPMLLTLQGIMSLRSVPPEYDKAEAAFRKALETESESIAALMGMASVAATRGAFSQALEFSSKAAGIAPQSESIDLWRAEILFRMQRYLEARDILENVLSGIPGNAAALELLVNTYLATDQLREAERTLERLQERIGPDQERAQVLETLRGRIMLAQGNPSDAESVLRKQHAANPDDFNTVRSLAFALAQQNQLQEAESILRQYVETHDTDPEAFVALARFYLGLNDPSRVDAASTALTRALAYDNDFLPALRALVDVQLRRGSPAGILAACDRYLMHDPLNAAVLFAKANVLSREPAREQEALTILTKAISQERQPEYLALRGMLYLRAQDYAAALKDLRDASLDEPNTTAEFDAALAEAYWGLDEKDLARTYYESARAKLQTSGDVPPWLKRLEEKLEQEN